MKRISILFMFVFLCVGLSAQSGLRTQIASGIPGEVSTNQLSVNNAWFGSSLQSQISGDGAIGDKFAFNANVLYNITFDSSAWNFPVVAEFELPIQGGPGTVDVGVFPYTVLGKSREGAVFVLHGGLGYSLAPVPTIEEIKQAQTFRALIGLEASIPTGFKDLPLTVSVTPLFETRNLDIGSNFAVEADVIIPIDSNLGILGNLYIPIDKDGLSTQVNAGVVINGAIGN